MSEKMKEKKNSKQKIILCVALCAIVIFAVTVVINSITFMNATKTKKQDTLIANAEGTRDDIEQWLDGQADFVEKMKATIETMDKEDTDGIMDCLEEELKKNEDALMYYCCFAYKGGVFTSRHYTLDFDPSTENWWKDAVAKDELIYIEPSIDPETKQSVVSIAVPLKIQGEQAVVFAEVTLERVIKMVQGAGTDEGAQAFLLADDNSVITHENAIYLPTDTQYTILNQEVDVDLDNENVTTFKDYDEVEKYCVVRKVETTGWKVGITQDMSIMKER